MNDQPVLLHDLLARHAVDEKTAVIDRDRSIGYRAMWSLAQCYACALRDSGLSRGDRVAIFLPRGIEESVSIFAVSLAAGVFVPINILLRGQQITHIVTDCGEIGRASCRERVL